MAITLIWTFSFVCVVVLMSIVGLISEFISDLTSHDAITSP